MRKELKEASWSPSRTGSASGSSCTSEPRQEISSRAQEARATLDRTKGYRGQAKSSFKRAKEALLKADSYCTPTAGRGSVTSGGSGSRDQRRGPPGGPDLPQFMHGLTQAA